MMVNMIAHEGQNLGITTPEIKMADVKMVNRAHGEQGC